MFSNIPVDVLKIISHNKKMMDLHTEQMNQIKSLYCKENFDITDEEAKRANFEIEEHCRQRYREYCLCKFEVASKVHWIHHYNPKQGHFKTLSKELENYPPYVHHFHFMPVKLIMNDGRIFSRIFFCRRCKEMMILQKDYDYNTYCVTCKNCNYSRHCLWVNEKNSRFYIGRDY